VTRTMPIMKLPSTARTVSKARRLERTLF